MQTNGSAVWQERTQGLLNATIEIFFPNGIGYEVACEKTLDCTIDMYSYKAYLIRWMAATTKLAPFTYNAVISVIQTSAKAAALQCCGSPADRPNGRMCGLSWSKGSTWDGTSGVGQQMAALEAVTSNLIGQSRDPVTNSSGGTSQGNNNAGLNDPAAENPISSNPPTTGDKVGASFLTIGVAVSIIGGLTWLSLPDTHR